MSEKIYTGGYDEKHLSRFQRPQEDTNNCGEYSVAAAISLLLNRQLDYEDVVEFANKKTLLHSILTLGLAGKSRRLWPGGPTAPSQQVTLAIETGKKHGLKLYGKHMMGTTGDLLHYLKQPDTAVLVTIGWDEEHEPRMFHADGSLIKLTVGSIVGEIENPFEAHVMLLAAHDPEKRSQRGDLSMHTPWGLLNWLVDGQDESAAGYGKIFWMTDKEFQDAWLYDIPLVGSNMAVISKHPIPESQARTRADSMEGWPTTYQWVQNSLQPRSIGVGTPKNIFLPFKNTRALRTTLGPMQQRQPSACFVRDGKSITRRLPGQATGGRPCIPAC